MLGFLLLFMIQAPEFRTRTVYFEDIRLHRGSPPVTVQVAWNEPFEVSTASTMPAMVSVFEGPRGSRRLVLSRIVGRMYDPYDGTDFLKIDRRSGEAFLVLPLSVNSMRSTGVIGFDGKRPKALLIGWYEAERLTQGKVIERSSAREVGLRQPKGWHPDPPVERILRYDGNKRKFVNSKWQVAPFNGPHKATIEGGHGGHYFRLEMSQRNFRIGNRKLARTKDGAITLDGMPTFGSGGWDLDEVQSLKERGPELFMKELTSFQVWVDGREWAIPAQLWQTCFEVHLEPKEYLWAWLSEDGQKLVVKANASDAGGSYSVVWTLRANGRHVREIGGGC